MSNPTTAAANALLVGRSGCSRGHRQNDWRVRRPLAPVRPTHGIRARRKIACSEVAPDDEIEDLPLQFTWHKDRDRRIQLELTAHQTGPRTADIERESDARTRRTLLELDDHRVSRGVSRGNRDSEKAASYRRGRDARHDFDLQGHILVVRP